MTHQLLINQGLGQPTVGGLGGCTPFSWSTFLHQFTVPLLMVKLVPV